MNRRPPVRLACALATVALLAVGCAEASNERASGWQPDEELAVELETAERRVSERAGFEARIGELAAIDPELVTCVVDDFVGARGEAAPGEILDPDTDGAREIEPLQRALAVCGADRAVAEAWIPPLAVELTTHGRFIECVAEASRPWVAERVAQTIVDGSSAAGDDADEEPSLSAVGREAELDHNVDEVWLAGAVDRCDAGAAMMAAIATVHPQIGEDARTPRRWLCAAGKAPDGTFDDAVDPSVVESEPRAAGLEAKIAPFFEDC